MSKRDKPEPRNGRDGPTDVDGADEGDQDGFHLTRRGALVGGSVSLAGLIGVGGLVEGTDLALDVPVAMERGVTDIHGVPQTTGSSGSFYNGPYGHGSYFSRFLLPDNGLTNWDGNSLQGNFYSFQVGTVLFIGLAGNDVNWQTSDYSQTKVSQYTGTLAADPSNMALVPSGSTKTTTAPKVSSASYRSGSVRLKLKVTGKGTLTVKVTTKSGKKTITLGAHKVSVKKSGTVSTSVSLSKSAKSLIKRESVKTTVTITFKPSSKGAKTVSSHRGLIIKKGAV